VERDHDSRAARRVREAVRGLITDGLARGIFPGAVVVIVQGRRTLVHQTFGHAQVTPRRREMRRATVFDLASLTKPIATTTAILQLWERGVIDLDTHVAAFLPRFAAGGKETVTIRHLLTHTAGLPGWEMLYLPGLRRGDGTRAPACRSIMEAVARICATPATVPPGQAIEYSDLGFIVLGYLVERLTGQSLVTYAHRHIFGPLGMASMRYTPPRSWRSRCAATELGNTYERTKAASLDVGRRFAWRSYLLRGEVHDGNAWHLGRGVAGHAGVFGTAWDVARFGVATLSGGALQGVRILRSETVAEATRNQTSGVRPPPRGLGWALRGWPILGTRASSTAFGHTGFTGTSVVIDPARSLVIALLTNRVHPHVADDKIVQFRSAFHDPVIEAYDG